MIYSYKLYFPFLQLGKKVRPKGVPLYCARLVVGWWYFMLVAEGADRLSSEVMMAIMRPGSAGTIKSDFQ